MENATRVGWLDMKVGDGEVTWSSVGGQVGVHRSPEQSDLVIIIIFYHINAPLSLSVFKLKIGVQRSMEQSDLVEWTLGQWTPSNGIK